MVSSGTHYWKFSKITIYTTIRCYVFIGVIISKYPFRVEGLIGHAYRSEDCLGWDFYIKNGDIIEMKLDLNVLELSFKINDKMIEKTIKVEKSSYKTFVSLSAPADGVEFFTST